MGFRVKTVSAMTGIPRPTLMAWERRYGVPSPGRGGGGYREYSEEDVVLLRRLKGLVDQGHPIGEAIGMLDAATPEGTEPFAALREGLLRALLHFDRPAIERYEPRLQTLPFSSLIDQVYLPILKQVGDEWIAGICSITQEHFASHYCRERILSQLQALGAGPVEGPSVACTTPPGEHHEIAALAICVKLALSGFRVTWLGPDLPVGDLCAYLAAHLPKLLCVSVMAARSDAEVIAYARALRAAAPREVQIAMGGAALAGLDPAAVPGVTFHADFGTLRPVLASLRS